GSVGSPHVRVGNCQASIKKNPVPEGAGFFAFVFSLSLKLSHLLLADSTFKPFLGIVSCLDV
ncbi:hypothetical protein, partial [Enterobacter quasiroggenkampii]|uniref:hypothetical protein n=1 Tax=Enterobacter quasiroggenkampii TaxID=2497436 RepID=UPI0021D0E764